ncbi:hypothetical protein V8G54_000581 [Vigna mungo]|uniref:Uncharacterized protein n=1 Tax=Vigna mungo TaxID=3915 RepID=A0AAQ3S936_VIGMU
MRFSSCRSRFVLACILSWFAVAVGHNLTVIDGRIASCLLQVHTVSPLIVYSVSHSSCLYFTIMLTALGSCFMWCNVSKVSLSFIWCNVSVVIFFSFSFFLKSTKPFSVSCFRLQLLHSFSLMVFNNYISLED